MYYIQKTNQYIGNGLPFELDGNQYPANWLELASDEEKTAAGIIPVETVGERNDDRFYDNADSLVDGKLVITSTQQPIETIKATAKQKIATNRYLKEIGGVSLLDGSKVDTDRDAQAKLSGALLFVQRNPTATIDWKGAGGWTTLNKEQIEAIADAVASHVQSCFTEERLAVIELDAITEFDPLVEYVKAIN